MNITQKYQMEQGWKPVISEMSVNSIQLVDTNEGTALVIFAEEELIKEFLEEKEPLMVFHFFSDNIQKIRFSVNYNDNEGAIEKKGNVFETTLSNNSKTKRMLRKLKTQPRVITSFFTPHKDRGFEFRRSLAFAFDPKAHWDMLKYF